MKNRPPENFIKYVWGGTAIALLCLALVTHPYISGSRAYAQTKASTATALSASSPSVNEIRSATTTQQTSGTPVTIPAAAKLPTREATSGSRTDLPHAINSAQQGEAARPSETVNRMESIDRAIMQQRALVHSAQTELIAIIDQRAATALSATRPDDALAKNEEIRATQAELRNTVEESFRDAMSVKPETSFQLQEQVEAGLGKMDTSATKTDHASTGASTTQTGKGAARGIAELFDALTNGLRDSSANMWTIGADQVFRDSNDDGISDYDSANVYGLDPIKLSPLSTMGTTTLNAGEKVLLGYDPRIAELVTVTPEEPTETLAPITSVHTVREMAVSKDHKIVISGSALPNSYVTLYIYSTPIVARVRADVNGNWQYTLDQGLENGEHVMYAGTVNSLGKIVAKSTAVLFTKTADAVMLESYPTGVISDMRAAKLLNHPLAVPVLIASIFLIILALFLIGKDPA